jgi:RHS repeat-associated protein
MAGRLVQVYANGGANVTPMDYLGTTLIAEMNGSNQLIRRYVHGPGDDAPLVWYEGSGTSDKRWLHADERGSIVAITDTSGNAIAINRYDEYGIPASTNVGRFQYTGQAWIPELGMYYYKARIYSPTLGRFMQTDPIGYDDGLNWYDYVGGDPVNAKDTSGTSSGWYGRSMEGHEPEKAGSPLRPGGPSYDNLGSSSLVRMGLGRAGEQALSSRWNKAFQQLLVNHVSGMGHSSTPSGLQLTSNTILGPAVLPDGGFLYDTFKSSLAKATFVGSALKDDPGVIIATNPLVRREAVANGVMFSISSEGYYFGSILLQNQMRANGRSGVVEYIMPLNKDFFIGRPIINHARFIPGAPISGYPNNFSGSRGHYSTCVPPLCI